MPGGVTLQFVARDASKRGGATAGAAAGAGSAGGEPTELLTAVSTTAFAQRVLEMHGADPDAAAAAATQHMAEVV